MSARSSSSTSSRFYINTISILFLVFLELFVHAHSLTPTKFVVFGSSGKTGAAIVRRIFSENIPNCQVICPVRDMAKARALLGPESRRLSLVPCNLLQDGTEKLATLVSSADAVIICSAYSPGHTSRSLLLSCCETRNLISIVDYFILNAWNIFWHFFSCPYSEILLYHSKMLLFHRW